MNQQANTIEIECIIPRSESFDPAYKLNGSMENMPNDKDVGVYFSEGKAVKKTGEYFKLTHHMTKRTFALARISNTDAILFRNFSKIHQDLMLKNDVTYKPETLFTEYRYQIVADVVSVSTQRPEWLCGGAFVTLATRHRIAASVKGRMAINPVNQARLPIFVDDYTGVDARIGIPAHNEADRSFAITHRLPIIPVVAQDFGEPLLNAKDVSGVVVIGYDPKTKRYLALKNGIQGWLVGGGHEEGETYEQTARRELKEEAGFAEVTAIMQLGDPVYSYYYNDIKKSNRRSLGYNYLAIVDRSVQQAQQQEANESFEIWWTEFDALYHDIEKTGGGVEHWLDALRRAKAAVKAYEAGQAYMPACYVGEGTMVNSGAYDGLASAEARNRIVRSFRSGEVN
jgi:8-oxo-dGTP pyrophosphatase MutT (NUDIX family)